MSELCNNSACFSVEIKDASDICVTFVVYACGKSIKKHLPPTAGKRKKPLTGRGFRVLSYITDDTAVLRNQSRRFFSPPLNQRRPNTV